MAAVMIETTTEGMSGDSAAPSSEEPEWLRQGMQEVMERIRSVPDWAQRPPEEQKFLLHKWIRIMFEDHWLEERMRLERAEDHAIAASEAAQIEARQLTLPTPADDTERFVQNTLVRFNQGRAHTFKNFYTAGGRRETVDGYTYYQFLALAQKYGYTITQFKPSFKDGRPVNSY
jgi:hypothetical protein